MILYREGAYEETIRRVVLFCRNYRIFCNNCLSYYFDVEVFCLVAMASQIKSDEHLKLIRLE